MNTISKKYLLLILALVIIAASAYFYYKFNFTAPANKPVANQDNLLKPEEKKIATSTIYIFTKNDLVSSSTKANLKDSNNDGITDAQAKKMGLDPNKLDTDGDGIFDIDEIKITHTNPFKKDTDGDGYNDLDEIRNGYNPNGPGKLEIKK